MKLEGGDIELGAPGTIEFKATRKEWTGPKGSTVQATPLSGAFEGCSERLKDAAATGSALS